MGGKHLPVKLTRSLGWSSLISTMGSNLLLMPLIPEPKGPHDCTGRQLLRAKGVQPHFPSQKLSHPTCSRGAAGRCPVYLERLENSPCTNQEVFSTATALMRCHAHGGETHLKPYKLQAEAELARGLNGRKHTGGKHSSTWQMIKELLKCHTGL